MRVKSPDRNIESCCKQCWSYLLGANLTNKGNGRTSSETFVEITYALHRELCNFISPLQRLL